MIKIPCLFVREFDGPRTSRITESVTPGCEWVLAGEGIATRKRDGTACAVIRGELYKRYDAKQGKVPPAGAIPCQEPDPIAGHWPHWVKIGAGPEDKWFREAWAFLNVSFSPLVGERTYELCGPKIGANAERLPALTFFRHGDEPLVNVPRTFDGLRDYLAADPPIEGIVFHHPDGRMVKIRRHDFGFKWP